MEETKTKRVYSCWCGFVLEREEGGGGRREEGGEERGHPMLLGFPFPSSRLVGPYRWR